MTEIRNQNYLLAVRASGAAAMLGVSESQLRDWVSQGKVHKPYKISRNIVLFDVIELAIDWDRMKEAALAEMPAQESIEADEEVNPWDEVLK